MAYRTFLEKLAATLLADYKDQLINATIVLPNRRAKVFLLDALKSQVDHNIFAPQITSIEDFIQELAGIRGIESIEVLFEFYNVYLDITSKEKQQTFDQFANWAKTLLQDFNEIDRYLLNTDYVLSYLKDIEDLKHWSLDLSKRTPLIEKHLQFWNLLPQYYKSLYKHLLDKQIGYQGLIYREAVAKIGDFATIADHQYIFAGFNALNAAEEIIIQKLIAENKAKIYWDIDSVFLNDQYHDAGMFLRKFKDSWKYYKNNPFEWITTEFSESKNIKIIGTPKTIGQAKIAGSIIDQLIGDKQNDVNRIAMVLGEESLLIPILYALPAKIEALNITMGYGAKNNPAQILISKLFKLHVNAIARNPKGYVMYYKDVIDILTHPLVEPYANAADLLHAINQNNYTFITHQRLLELNPNHSALFKLLFDKWDEGAMTVLESLATILLLLKSNLSNDNSDDKVAKAFVFSVFKVVNKITSYFAKQPAIESLEMLHAIYKQVIDLAEVSFEGEPLKGLQIMGVLESRVLDFDTVIITSMNEGTFPAGKSQNSFIPYDIKRELGLPTFKEKDAIYTYHFYHLLQRAKNIYLLYNTESEGLDGGEKSRFITQLEVETQPAHQITHEIYHPDIPDVAYTPIVIPKSELVMKRLKTIATDGFSPSALTSYIRNPLRFYYQKILRIREVEEVEESIALNTLGTIIHETLRALYQPFIGKLLTVDSLKFCITQIDKEVLTQFKEVYKEGDIKKGRNLLAFEVAKRNVLNFLKAEIQSLSDGVEVKIIALETTFQKVLEHHNLPFPVLIRGNVDRIEERTGVIRIIDYKTGKVNAPDVVLKQWNGLTSDIKNDKIIQLLAYAFIYQDEVQNKPIEVGIISFKNMKAGFMPFKFKADKDISTIVTSETIENYTDQLVALLKEILDAEIPFTEKII